MYRAGLMDHHDSNKPGMLMTFDSQHFLGGVPPYDPQTGSLRIASWGDSQRIFYKGSRLLRGKASDEVIMLGLASASLVQSSGSG